MLRKLERSRRETPGIEPLNYRPNLHRARRTPLRFLEENGSLDAVEHFVAPMLAQSFIGAAEDTGLPSPLLWPDYHVPYPIESGAYLRIGGLGILPVDSDSRPRALLVVRVAPPRSQVLPTITRVGLIGNLVLPPTHDVRGAFHNFGLPRGLQIYAADWPEESSLDSPPPHPRDWTLLHNEPDVRADWGWTYFDFEPVRTSHLVFVLTNLPTIPKHVVDEANLTPKLKSLRGIADEKDVDWEYRGLTIERLAVYRYEETQATSRTASYVPVGSWHSDYLGNPSDYWAGQQVAAPEAAFHPSIYRVNIGKGYSYDMLPSGLVGLPSERPISVGFPGVVENDGYSHLPGYSGDLMPTDAGPLTTRLVVRSTDTQPSSIIGLRLAAALHPPSTQVLGDWTVRVFATNDRALAYSPSFSEEMWLPLGEHTVFPRGSATGAMDLLLYGGEIRFDDVVAARFYSLELKPPDAAGLRLPFARFALKSLELLRDPHHTISAYDRAAYHVESIQIRMVGPDLLSDYAGVSNQEIMDVSLEHSLRGKAFSSLVRLTSLLDVREKSQPVLIGNQRGTRAVKQTFVEEHDANLQRALNVSRQTMLAGTVADRLDLGSDSRVSELSNDASAGPSERQLLLAELDRILDDIQGITTDRDAGLDAGTTVIDLISVLARLGVPGADLLVLLNSIINMDPAEVFPSLGEFLWDKTFGWIGDAWNSVFGGGDAQDAGLEFVIGQLNPANFLTGLYGSNLDSLPHRPSISLSGSFGGQFIAGGSFGTSVQLDGGKSTTLSTGRQAQANDSAVITRAARRRHTRAEESERTEWEVWKGKETRYAGYAVDIITTKIPVGLILNPVSADGQFADTVRLRVGTLPPGVHLSVEFVGKRLPVDRGPR